MDKTPKWQLFVMGALMMGVLPVTMGQTIQPNISTTPFTRSLLNDTNAAEARATLGISGVTPTNGSFTNATLTGTTFTGVTTNSGTTRNVGAVTNEAGTFAVGGLTAAGITNSGPLTNAGIVVNAAAVTNLTTSTTIGVLTAAAGGTFGALTGNATGTTNAGPFTNTHLFSAGSNVIIALNAGIRTTNVDRPLTIQEVSTGQPQLFLQQNNQPNGIEFSSPASSGDLIIYRRSGGSGQTETEIFRIFAGGGVTNPSTLGVAGNVIFSANLTMVQDLAFKATTTLWTIISDAETKDNIVSTTKGSAEFLAVPIKEFDYNGKFGTETGKHSIGIVAQDLAASAFASSVKPLVFQDTEKSTNMVEGSPVVIDIPKGDPKTVLSVNLHEYFMAGFQTIKEQQVLITNLLARIAVLEAK